MDFLRGLTVLDLASVGPAARASRMLADYGMDVIKLAPVAAHGGVQIESAFYAYGAGRGMRRIRLDLKSPQGRAALSRLVVKTDVLIESFRPGVAARLGVGYDDLVEHNPLLIYCSTSGYGQQGPYSQWAGHDINYLAATGFLACSGHDSEGVPAIPGATVADSAGGGMHAAMAIIAALLNRFRHNEGAYLDVAATDGMLGMMSLYLDQYTATGFETRSGNALLTGKYAWYGVYPTADGKAVSVGAIEPHFFRNLCRTLDLDQFADSQYDGARQAEMKAAFKRVFLSRDRDQWTQSLAAADTCMAPVLSIAEVVADPHYQARASFMKARHPDRGEFSQLAPVLAGCERQQSLFDTPAAGATDSEAVFSAAGFSDTEIQNLRQAGVLE